MFTVAERPTIPSPVSFAPRAGEGAAALAGACGDWASACWRGDRCASRFASLLGAYWHPDLPSLPGRSPDAISVHGGGGRGIHWFEIGDEIRGYIPGARGGYRVPQSVVPLLARSVSDKPRASRGDGAHMLARSGEPSGMTMKGWAHGF